MAASIIHPVPAVTAEDVVKLNWAPFTFWAPVTSATAVHVAPEPEPNQNVETAEFEKFAGLVMALIVTGKFTRH